MTRHIREEKQQGVSRREFLWDAAGTGALLALSPALAQGQRHTAVTATALAPVNETRTLFFNLSHEQYSGHAYYLVIGKQRPQLRPVGLGDPALAKARMSNRFLAAVPTSQITHVIDAVGLNGNSMNLSYIVKDPETGSGKWEMSAFYLLPPMTAYPYAYAQAQAKLTAGAAPLVSAKRKNYGLPAAASLQDLLEEQALLDTTDWATAMVNMHPEMLSVEPHSGAYIQTQHIQANPFTPRLAEILGSVGPAAPQQSASLDNDSGWATLVPLTDPNGDTLRSTRGNNKGLNLYTPQWQPQINSQFVAPVLQPALRAVKNDTSLGADVTNSPTTGLLGTIWNRSDGVTSVNQSPGAANTASNNASYTLKSISQTQNGYSCSATTATGSGSTSVKLSTSNWFLRYLGVWLQFLDANGKVVPVSNLPSGLVPEATHVTSNNEFLIGSISPEFTLYGVPISPSAFSYTFDFPVDVAASARILASGLGEGSHTFPETEQEGVIMTSLFNYAIPTALMLLGVSQQLPLFVSLLFIPLGLVLAKELALAGMGGTPSQLFTLLWTSFVRGVASGPAFKAFLAEFTTLLTTSEVVDDAEDAIPVAGFVLQALSALATIAEIYVTTVDVLQSPFTYEYDLVGTYDLSLVLLPDPKDPGGFPAAAATYKVVASFDGGAPHRQTLSMPGNGVKSLPAVVFAGVPLGGRVTLTVGFYTADGTQVGHGATGSILNVPPQGNAAGPTITITEDQLPIHAGTTYQHKQKIALDAQGNHEWICAPAPAVPATPSACGPNPGNICAYRSISYNSGAGNIGYAWQSYSTHGCDSGTGQLDQLANLPSVDNGSNAQGMYAMGPCSLIGATKLVYDPLGRAGMNFYVDTTNQDNLLRRVELNPPVFSSPLSNQAWGKFNLFPDDMLLHPSGAIVTINQTQSKMESLVLPATAMTDAQAAISLIADVHAGAGTRPGLFSAPAVATVNTEGVVLVVESGNNRIHAVDVTGNPVRLFTKQPEPYFLYLTKTGSDAQYLDIAVEFNGFIYILSYSNSVYRLDIYHGDQSGTDPISTTMGFNAAKVTVDYWRNVYSLNYEVLTINGSLPPSGVTEPSISQWIPTAPPACEVAPSTLAAFQGPPSPRLFRRRDLWQLASKFL
jgi:hypothetical protein